MEENELDRELFVASRDRPPQSSSWGGVVLLLAVVGLVGFVGYKYVEANGIPDFGRDAKLAHIARKLNEIEERLDRLEKRRKTSSAESAPDPARTEPAPPGFSSSPSVAQTSSRVFVVGKRLTGDSAGANPAYDKRLSGLEENFGSLRGDVRGNREAWEATTDRLAEAVGDMSVQRREIARMRESLNQLSQQGQRTEFPFILHKRMGRQRIGPVWLWLRSTDPKAGRYTLRVFVEDKWVEMKDRVLQVPVQFYLSGIAVPLELVVFEIHEDQVAGYLAVPQAEGVRR